MTTKSAIPTDVQTEETTAEDPPRKPVKSDRVAALEAIGTARNADFERETGVKIEPFVAPAGEDDDPDAAEAEAERRRLEAEAAAPAAVQEPAERAASIADAALQAAQTSAAAVDPKAKIKLKVDGAEVEMSIEDMQREVQKGLTADRRLEEAARQRRELETQQATLQQQAKPDVTVGPDVATKFTTAVQSGDVVQATQAFQEAVSSAVQAATEKLGRGNATPVDPQAIAAQVRQQIAIDSVLAQSRADYPQLYADPDIEAVAASKIARLQGEGKPFAEALESVQAELSSKFGWKKAEGRQAPTPDTSRREEKLKRKAEMAPPPSGLSVKSGSTEEKPQSTSDIIREMAKLRGQNV